MFQESFDAPKVVTVSHTVPQSFSTENIMTPTINTSWTVQYASENVMHQSPKILSSQQLLTLSTTTERLLA